MLRLTRLFSTTAVASKIGYKKPLSAYQQFVKDTFPKLKESNASATLGELSKVVSAQWKEAPESVRGKYQADYEKNLEASKNKDPAYAYVIKPEAPFDAFTTKNYKKVAKTLKSKDKKEIADEISRLWNEVPEEEKTKLSEKYKKALRKYKKETSKYKDIPRPINPFFQFSIEERKSAKYEGLKLGEVSKLVGQAWRELSDAEKAHYYDQHAQQKSQYEKLLAEAKGPARPLSRYLQFVKEKYPEIQEANPNAKNSEIIKLIAEEWKTEKDYY